MAIFLFFQYPRYLFFLLFIPLLIALHFFTLKGFRSKALVFANFEAISRIKGIDFFSKNILILAVSIAMVFLSSLALSGLTATIDAETNEQSIVIAIDSSQSMEANDFYPSRLEAAKDISSSFVKSAPFKSRFGVVSFSGSSVVMSEMTDDKDNVVNAIESISFSQIGGTDIFEAVSASSNILTWEDSKAIVLFSDGQLNVGNIEEAIDYARKNKVIVNTVAMGTSNGGETSFGVSTLDEQSLQALAFNTDGKYAQASSKEELENAINEIFSVTKKKVDVDLTRYLFMLVIVLFVIEYILFNTRYKTFP